MDFSEKYKVNNIDELISRMNQIESNYNIAEYVVTLSLYDLIQQNSKLFSVNTLSKFSINSMNQEQMYFYGMYERANYVYE